MSFRHIPLKLIVAAIAAMIAFHPATRSDAAEGRRIVIEIQKFKFVTPAQKARPGDTVVWVNKDIVPHTATAKDGSWDSGQIEPGGEWRMVVEEEVPDSNDLPL